MKKKFGKLIKIIEIFKSTNKKLSKEDLTELDDLSLKLKKDKDIKSEYTRLTGFEFYIDIDTKVSINEEISEDESIEEYSEYESY